MKKTRLCIASIFMLLGLLILVSQENSVYATVVPVPATPGINSSSIYTLTVNGQDVFVGSEDCYGGYTYETASFCMSDTVTVSVTVSSTFTNHRIRPDRHNISSTKIGNTITFDLSKPLKLYLEFDSLTPLLLFATPLETDVPSPTDPDVLYFGPGTHEAGVIIPQSGQTIYLAPGSLVKGRIVANGVSNVTIKGRGTLNTVGYTKKSEATRGIDFINSNNITIEGIAHRNGESWQQIFILTDNINISHVNLLAFGQNNDGIDIDGCKNVMVKDSFIGCGDDGFGWHAVNALRHGEPITENCIAVDCVILNKHAGNGIRIGNSMETQDFRDITFKNIDILERYGPAVQINNSDWALIRNVRFENIVDEEVNKTRALEIKIQKNGDSSSVRDERGYIDGIYFKNFRHYNPNGVILLEGYDNNHTVNYIYFENSYLGNNKIDSLSDLTYNSFVNTDHLYFNLSNLFTEDFEDGISQSDWNIQSGTWTTAMDGSNVMKQTSTIGESVIVAGSKSWKDYVVQSRIKIIANGASNMASGIIGRYTDSNNYYLYRLNSHTNRVELLKKVDGTFTTIKSTPMNVNTDQWYTLKLVMDGNSIHGYVDGINNISVIDTSITHGYIGLRTYGQAVQLDNVAAWLFYHEDFESGYAADWNSISGSWSVLTDQTKLLKQSQSVSEALITSGSKEWRDYSVAGDFMFYNATASSATGIIARYTDNNNFYLLRLHSGSGKVQLYKNVAGVYTLLQENDLTINMNTTYRLNLVVIGNTISGYVDNTLMVSTTDDSHSSGCIGARSFKQEFSIDNIEVNK